MDLFNELFGTFSGMLSLVVVAFMGVAMPIGIWWVLAHPKASVCEEMDRKAHAGQQQD